MIFIIIVLCITNYFLSYNLQNFFESITGGYKDKDLPTLKYRWDRWVDLRGQPLISPTPI